MTSPEVEVVEETGRLLDEETTVERPSDHKDRRRCGRPCRSKCGWFLIEPVLAAYCFCDFPMKIITQMYARITTHCSTMFEKTCATTQKNVKCHDFWIFEEKNVKT